MKTLITVLISGAIIYCGAALYLYMTQDSRIFNRKWAKEYKPEIAKETEFTTDNGIVLTGAYVNHGSNLPLVLYFGGNANNVIEFLDKTATRLKKYNFIGFNYPGYAGSGGKPCEKCILKFALEIYNKYKPDILFGRSLGTSVATYAASKKPVKKLILVTPFDSIENIAKNKYPFFPVDKLLKYKFREYVWMKDVKAPVSVLLVKNDNVIPEKDSENLLNSIPDLKRKITISGVEHGNVYQYDKIVSVLNDLLN